MRTRRTAAALERIDAAVLLLLAETGYEWNRPMDIGGSDGSGHNAVLTRLVRQGKVDRRRRHGGSVLDKVKGNKVGFVYRIHKD